MLILLLSLLLQGPQIFVEPQLQQNFSFFHEELTHEWGMCLEIKAKADSVWVQDFKAAIVQYTSSIESSYGCVWEENQIRGTWHNHVAFATPTSGHGCDFSDLDRVAQKNHNHILDLVSCGVPGNPVLIVLINPDWKTILETYAQEEHR